jgi:hypothetical protein
MHALQAGMHAFKFQVRHNQQLLHAPSVMACPWAQLILLNRTGFRFTTLVHFCICCGFLHLLRFLEYSLSRWACHKGGGSRPQGGVERGLHT